MMGMKVLKRSGMSEIYPAMYDPPRLTVPRITWAGQYEVCFLSFSVNLSEFANNFIS